MNTPSLLSRQSAAARIVGWVASVAGVSVVLAGAWRAVLLTVAVALGGCAVLPSQVERPLSQARTDVAATPLARAAAASTGREDEPEASAFRLLADGGQALDARIALIRRAERSIDVQYYLIASDGTGLAFLRELRDAAARGVRVRILIDDLYAAGQDELLAGLAAHANVAVRMFNPLPVRGGSLTQRVVLSLHQFARINRRMHNKLFIADSSFAVTGGRNIADEYFDRSGEANFIDMDVLSAGPVVRELAATFDRFWNSELAFPIASLVKRPIAAAAFDRIAEAGPALLPAETTADAPALDSELDAGRVGLEPARVELLADRPLKADAGDAADPTVASAHLALIRSARDTVELASPYFIPGARAMKALAEVRARDVAVSVLTNSLATTDEPLVHLGYARYRAALLDAGVDLHELIGAPGKATRSHLIGAGSGRGASLGRLHSKLTLVDGARVFIGSMNMDPRSARFNTEAALVIHSPALAAQLSRFLAENRDGGSYQVRQSGPERRLGWHAGVGAGRRALAEEPGSGERSGIAVRMLARLVDEEML